MPGAHYPLLPSDLPAVLGHFFNDTTVQDILDYYPTVAYKYVFCEREWARL